MPLLNALRYVLWLARLVVSLRYRIRVHGWEQVRDLKNPVLLLPNHPGYVDPVLILTAFYGALSVSSGTPSATSARNCTPPPPTG
jgi:1-acyl-sn-glycerol-3-phosphate acyltransferase